MLTYSVFPSYFGSVHLLVHCWVLRPSLQLPQGVKKTINIGIKKVKIKKNKKNKHKNVTKKHRKDIWISNTQYTLAKSNCEKQCVDKHRVAKYQ